MLNYTVEISVDGFYTWQGEARNREEAIQMALDEAGEADFGVLENVDFSISSAEED